MTIAAGSTTSTIIITIALDGVVEGDETVIVDMGIPTNALQGASATHTATITDDDGAGMTVTESGGSTSVAESATTDTFTVVLDAEPVSDVVISVTSGDTGEASVSPSALTFTPGNWDTPQAVTVTGVDDSLLDGSQSTTITVAVNDGASNDGYDGVADQSVTVSTTDDDTAGMTLSETTATVSEGGSTDTFTVVLDAEPGSDVVISVTSGDTGEATVSPSALTFSSGNWNTPQTVTVTGVDDSIIDDSQSSTVTASVNDGASDDDFDGVADQSVTVSTTDDDTAGMTLSKVTATVAESGTTDTFTVVLDAEPASDVVITVTSGDTGEATVSAAALTFTSGNWGAPQTVTVRGVEDNEDDGNKTTTVTVAVDAGQSDDLFDSVGSRSVVVTTVDDGLAWTGAEDALWSNPANWNAGRLPTSTDTLTLKGAGAIEIDGDVTLAGLVLGSGFTGTVTQGEGALTVNGDLVINGGTFAGGALPMDVNGSFVQTAGTFTSTSGELSVSGDFHRSGGTFAHHDGSVVLDGGDQAVFGDTTFHRLIKVATAPATLTFEAGSDTVVDEVLRLAGRDDARLSLASSDTGTSWNLLATGTVVLDTLAVRDCTNTGASELSCGNSLDVDNNLKLRFIDLDPPRATLANHPQGVSNSLSWTMTVGGIGVVSYMYRLDDGAWQAESLVENDLTCEVAEAGDDPVTLYVIGKSESGLWQRDEEVTTLSWRVDVTAPDSVTLYNVPAGTVGTTRATITVGGNEVTAYRYKMDDAGGEFGEIYSVSESISLTGLGAGSHTLYVIGADMAGNWQEAAHQEMASWTVNTDVPTAVLSDTPVLVTSETSATIGVSGTDSGNPIDRYAYTIDGGTTWETGSAGDPIELSALSDGEHTLYVNASHGGDWQDGVDGQSNILSATSWTWTVDTAAPSFDLFDAAQGVPASTSVALSWKVDESCRRYRLWIAGAPITEGALSSATEIHCGLEPAAAGTMEYFTVGGLSPGQTYYVAIRTMDTAGNESALDTDVVVTADELPVISNLSIKSGDNSVARELEITGDNFLESEGSNMIGFEGVRSAFHVESLSGTVTRLSARIPAGAPVGVYKVRVINKYGVSRVADTLYTITEAPVPMPVVTSVSPVVVSTGVETEITVYGANFGDDITAIHLLSSQGDFKASLTGVVTESSGAARGLVPVTGALVEGSYLIQVERDDGKKNAVSAVRLELSDPVNLSGQSGALITTRMVTVSAGQIPVDTTLTTDNRDEVGQVNAFPVAISAAFGAGAVLEEQQLAEAWNDYAGLVQPPRQVPVTDGVERTLGTDSVVFTLGADGLLRLKDGETLYVEITVSMPADVSVPSIYYVGQDGNITPAGVDGMHNGMTLAQGGTVLSTRPDVPEAGLITYTFGLLLDHMSTYALGTKVDPGGDDSGDTDNGGDTVSGDGGGSYGPCFVGATTPTPAAGLLVWALGLMGIMGVVGMRMVRRAFAVMAVATLVVLGGAEISLAGEAHDAVRGTTQKESPWSLKLGVGLGYIGEEYVASAGGTRYGLDVDNVASPVVRVGYAFSSCLTLEVKAAVDFYSGSMDTLATTGSSSVDGYTLGAGPLWYLGQRRSGLFGSWRPFLHAGASYRKLSGDLAYPVRNFDSTLGLEAGVGVECGQVDIRLGYQWAVFDESGTAAGYSPSQGSDDLDLSAVVLEVSWVVPYVGK
ncbi:hypothetical protein [Desulfoluna spongiiphila]|uniref:Fibronectin type-III domain-containing protein n=1 Tax=Desulfoluna spongiiphila TaxID=419481 RepID=A0A1G5EAN5_9BACT|nr:hypothetical protein [Desulfoluna spongiiphila]SCY23558.1 hypothetical protein SAMN05216233_105246 [Desulfoluna spongiiphila]